MAELIGGREYDDVQNTAPASPSIGDTWLDTSTDPPTGKIYADLGSGGQWTTDLLDTPVSNATPNLTWVGEGISNLSDSGSFTVSGSNLRGVTFKPDDTKFYVTDFDNAVVQSYSLSTAYDLTTASFVTDFDVNSEDRKPVSTKWSNDGSKLFMLGARSNSVYSYDASTAYDISTVTFNQSASLGVQNSQALLFNDDGTSLYNVDGADDFVQQFDLGSAFDLSNVSQNGQLDTSGQTTGPNGGAWADDGSTLHITDADNAQIYEYSVKPAYDVSTASFVKAESLDGGYSIEWIDNETYLIAMSNGGNIRKLLTGGVGPV